MADPWAVQSVTADSSSDPWAVASVKPLGAAKKAAPPKASLAQNVTGFMSNLNRGLGIGDELAAAADTAANFVQGKPADYRASLARQRQTEDSYAAQHPHMAALGKGTGMAATAAIPGGAAGAFNAPLSIAGRQVPQLVANAARGATVAATQGAAFAAADRGSAAERVQGARRAASDPMTLATGAALGAAATPFAAKAKQKPMSPDQLRAAKNAAYQAADQAGVRYTPQAFDQMAVDMAADLQRARVNPMRHPKAASMLQDVQAMSGQAPTLTELDQLRQVISSDVAGAADKAERRLGKLMVARIDSFIDRAGPGQVTAGNAQDAADLITRARDLNTRVRKVESVTSAVRSAELRAGSTGSGGNADNAIRQNLRRVLEKGSNFSRDEAQALESIVMGGKGQNLLRLVGKLSPAGNGLMAAGNLGAAALAGPLGAIPGAAGIVAKLAADNMTRQKVEQIIRLMANGGAPLARVPTGPAVARLAAPAAARLSGAAGVAGAARQGGAYANPYAQP